MTRLVLASASAARRRVLENAGIAVAIDAPGIDEDAIKLAARAQGATVAACAMALAEAKARAVAPRQRGRLVLAGDQMLELGEAWLDKPADRAAAQRQLQALSGRTHRLIGALVVQRDTTIVWRHVDSATLSMRALSDAFIADYLDAAGDAVFTSVGAYQIEGLGAQLFTRVEGDYFTVLGLSLLPLLGFLREQGILGS